MKKIAISLCLLFLLLLATNNTWKIKQYILSATVPNDQIDVVTKNKAPIEDLIIEKLTKNNPHYITIVNN